MIKKEKKEISENLEFEFKKEDIIELKKFINDFGTDGLFDYLECGFGVSEKEGLEIIKFIQNYKI